jgi:tetratricopeptide (TPR) repeat protein
LEVEVLEQRKAKLRKEHPYTLWSAYNLARIKALRGDLDEALSIMRPGIAIAERNLGATHIGTLFGKLHLGRVLLRAKQYREAEEMFLTVIKAHEGNRTGHGDRLLAIFSLIKRINLQGRRHETIDLREELLERTRAIFGNGHAWERYLLDPQNLSDSSPDAWVPQRSAEERLPMVPRLRSGGKQLGIARISTA